MIIISLTMIFFTLANFLRLNFFSQWTTVNKHSSTIIIGTLLWSILWQFTRSYTGNSIIVKSIYTGFYYIVLADLYTFFMTSSSIYNDNIYNKNFHDINYYNTLEMQPIPVRSFNTKINKELHSLSPALTTNDNIVQVPKIDDDKPSELSEDVSNAEETINKNEEIIKQST